MVTKPIEAKWRSLAVDLNTFIVAVFCLIDDQLKDRRIRRRGPAQALRLGSAHHGDRRGVSRSRHRQGHLPFLPPTLRRVVPRSVRGSSHHLRQAANLWAIKQMLWKHLLGRVRFDAQVSLIDSFPVPVCHFARAYRCRRLAEESAFGYDEMSKQTFYGLRAHLRVCWPRGSSSRWTSHPPTSMTCAWPRNCSKGCRGSPGTRQQELLES